MSTTDQCWRVHVFYCDGRSAKDFFHLDMHHSVKQYAAILSDMREPVSVHDAVVIYDNTGTVFRDSDEDPLNHVHVPYQDDDQRLGGNDTRDDYDAN